MSVWFIFLSPAILLILKLPFSHSPSDIWALASMDDLLSARMILSGIQPEDEPFLQYQLALVTKQERKCIQ